MTWDVTVVDTIAPSHIVDSALRACTAATKAEAQKSQKYASIALTHTFIPLAFETLGSWGPQSEEFVRNLGRHLILKSKF